MYVLHYLYQSQTSNLLLFNNIFRKILKPIYKCENNWMIQMLFLQTVIHTQIG